MTLKVAALALLLLATPAGAATIADVQKAYDAGDFATALSEAQPLADAGDVVAMRLLGLMYRQGQGVAVGVAAGGEVPGQLQVGAREPGGLQRGEDVVLIVRASRVHTQAVAGLRAALPVKLHLDAAMAWKILGFHKNL